MKTLLITALVLLAVAITASKEGPAEAIFRAFLYACIIASTRIYAKIVTYWRRRRIRRIKENNEYRRERIRCCRTMVVLNNEPLTEYEFEVTGN